jgi:hypothetical protein
MSCIRTSSTSSGSTSSRRPSGSFTQRWHINPPYVTTYRKT